MRFAILLLPSLILASYVHWLGDYDKAHQKALKEHKPLMVYLIKPNCNLCRSIIEKNFMNKPYIKRLNKNFIPIIVNYTDSRDFPNELYYSNKYPTLFFVDQKSEIFLTTPLKKEQINSKNLKNLLDRILVK